MTTSADLTAKIPNPPSSAYTQANLSMPAAPAPAWTLYSERQRLGYLAILFLVQISGNFDYYVLGVVLEPIKREFHVSDAALGVLSGFCFGLCYALAALPYARWSDRGNRRKVLAVALAGWSLMTLLFGFARSFLQLGMARVGVGAMEPGATPPAQSLIADYFPPERRGSALAIMLAGGSVGYLIGGALGGYISATLGWRNAFFIAGAVGLVLAVVTQFCLAEPRSQLGYPSATSGAETLAQAIKHLRVKRSYVYTLVGMSLLYFFSLGVTTFVPSFLIRALHVSLVRVSVTWGVAIAVANLLGILAGGWIADRLSRRDIRWYAWQSAIACVVGASLYWWALASNDLRSFVGIYFLAELVIWSGTFAAWPAVHAICGNSRRGMAIAVLQFAYILLGGVGPLAAGALSDLFAPAYGVQSLRYSMDVITFTLVPAAIAFYLSGRAMVRELEE